MRRTPGMRSAAFFGLCLAMGCAGKPKSAPAGRPVTAAPAARPARRPIALMTGELVARRTFDLFVPETPSWQVQIRWMEADGATVRKGQKVLELDNSVFAGPLEEKKLALQLAENDLLRQQADTESNVADKEFAVEQKKNATAKAKVEAVIPEALRPRREWQEKQLALKKGETELEKALEDLAAAKKSGEADLAIRRITNEAARREIGIAERSIASLVLLAPADGILVVAESPRERRKFQTGDTVWPGLALARIPDRAGMQVEAALYDVDDGLLVPGMKAVCTRDAEPGRTFKGVIAEIAAIAQEPAPNSLRRTLRVVVRLDRPDEVPLRPGQSVKVEVQGAAALPARGVVAPREDLALGVEVTGTLRALDSDQAGAPVLPDVWEYRLVQMAPEGSAVKKGNLLLRFDTADLVQKLEEKKAERDAAAKQIEKRDLELGVRQEALRLQSAEAEGRRRKAELKVEVPAELLGANELAQSRLDLDLTVKELAWIDRRKDSARRSAGAELSSLKSRCERAAARVGEIEDRIRQMTVPAPRDGTVIYLMNWRDEKKKVGDTCWRGERLVEVPDLARMIVKGEVDEAESERVTAGQKVALRLEAHPDTTFAGRVLTVGTTVQRQSPKIPKKIVRVDVALDASDPLRMRPGMRVRGSVEIERLQSLLVRPVEAPPPAKGRT